MGEIDAKGIAPPAGDEQTSTEPKIEDVESKPEEKPAEVKTEVEKEAEASDYKSLFEEENVLEESLMGVETEPQGEKKDPDTPGPKGDDPDNKATDDKTDKTDKPDDKPDDKVADDGENKPPPGMVPHEALHQSRKKNVVLREKIKTLEGQLSEAAAADVDPNTGKPKEFVELTVAKYDELVDNDPDAASKYIYRLQKHNEKTDAEAELEQGQQDLQTIHQNEIVKTVHRIEDEIPSYYDEDGKTRMELAQFAIDQGFSPEYLEHMTNPKTQILPPGKKTPFVLGDGAASVVISLNKAMNSAKSVDPEALKAQITADVKKSLKEQMTNDVMGKLHNNDDGDAYTSIGDTGGQTTVELQQGKDLTEEDMARMPEDQLEKVLMGKWS